MIALIAFLFFLSGITGLVLETVWFRELTLIFGSSAWATGTVTGAFLGGIGIGGLVASFLVDRLKNRVLLYGALEIFVGLYALATPAILNLLDGLQYSVLGGEMLDATPYAMIRFVAVFLVLLPPTLAMGMTLPILVRAMTTSELNVGSRIGVLYGINTIGAFSGVLLAGFWLLPAFGQSRSTLLIAMVAMTVGVVAVAASLILGVGKSGAVPDDDEKPLRKPLRPYGLLGAFLLFSGLSAMALQVSFVRLLSIIIGSSTYSFAITVAIYLLGIGLGSLLFAFLLVRRLRPFWILAASQGCLAGFLVLAVSLADKLPRWLALYASSSHVGVDTVFFVHGALAAVLILGPTLTMGVSFPAAMKLFSSGVSVLGRDVGRGVFLNTIGAIAGSFLGAFILVPQVGLHATIIFAAGLAAIWTALFLSAKEGFLLPKRLAIAMPIALAVAFFFQTMPTWDVGKLTSGMYRVGLARKLSDAGEIPRQAQLYYRDGPVGSVSVERREDILTMRINGKAEASNRFDMPTQVLVGMLPLLLHPKERGHEAALIGYGSGVTAGAMLQTPLHSLRAVELEPRVIEASRFFKSVNFEPRQDPRMKLIVGDARTVLGYGAEKFDVIVSEPSNPWVAGASGLFTENFYTMMARRLRDDGVYAQWLQLYELAPEQLRSLVRTFQNVFPNVLVFSASVRGVDLVLLGSRKPWVMNVDEIKKRAADDRIAFALRRAGVGGAFDLLSLLMVTESEIKEFTGKGPLNTDDNGLVEFAAPKDMLFYENFKQAALDFHFSSTHGNLLPILDDLGETLAEQAENLANLGLHLLAHGRTDTAYEAALFSLQRSSSRLAIEVKDVCELIYVKEANWPQVETGWLLIQKDDPKYVQLGMEMTQSAPAALKLANELAESDKDPRLQYLVGVLALRTLDFPMAADALVPLAEDEAFKKENPEVDFFAGRALDRQMKFQEAVRHLARYNMWRRENGVAIKVETDNQPGTVIEIPINSDDENSVE